MPVLWAVFYPGLSSRRTTEGLFKRRMSPGPQTPGPGDLVFEKPGLFSGPISLRKRMAAEKEGRGTSAGDDTRRDPSRKAFPEAHLTDPGGEGGDDTRQDRAPKTEPAYLCGLWIFSRVIQDKMDLSGGGFYAEPSLFRRNAWNRPFPTRFGSSTRWST